MRSVVCRRIGRIFASNRGLVRLPSRRVGAPCRVPVRMVRAGADPRLGDGRDCHRVQRVPATLARLHTGPNAHQHHCGGDDCVRRDRQHPWRAGRRCVHNGVYDYQIRRARRVDAARLSARRPRRVRNTLHDTSWYRPARPVRTGDHLGALCLRRVC